AVLVRAGRRMHVVPDGRPIATRPRQILRARLDGEEDAAAQAGRPRAAATRPRPLRSYGGTPLHLRPGPRRFDRPSAPRSRRADRRTDAPTWRAARSPRPRWRRAAAGGKTA